MDETVFRTGRTTASRPTGLLFGLAKVLVLAAAGIAVLAIMLIGFFVVLPLMLAAGAVFYFYLRRRVRQAQSRPENGVIDAEYTIIERR